MAQVDEPNQRNCIYQVNKSEINKLSGLVKKKEKY